ncbi:type II toxin-antitoxin system Phd/YefM family antitoxin, partial [Candidatus Entotheonella palauensis]
RETVIIHRRGKDSVALIALEELSGLLETAHLLCLPRNAERLLAALEQARRGEGKVMSVESLRESVGLSDDEEA